MGAEPCLTAAARRLVASSGIGNHLPLGLGSPGALDPAGLVTFATLLTLLVAAVGTLGAAGDRPGAGG